MRTTMSGLLAAPVLDLASLGKVLLASVVGGVGLVAVFALGLTGLSAYQTRSGAGQVAVSHAARARAVAGLVGALACFAAVGAGVGFGLYVLLASK